MVVTICTANQLHTFDPADVDVVKRAGNRNHIDIGIGRGSHVVEILTGSRVYQASVPRQKGSWLVLLDVAMLRGP